MSLSAFEHKEVRPDDDAVAKALGEKKALWDGVKEHIASNHKNVNEEWKFYSKDAGWTLVIKGGKRTLVYLIPLNGHFKVNFVFGENAVNAAQSAGLPAHIVKKITEARPYVEGRSFMVDVKGKEDADAVIELIGIKDRN
jgi:hypothetical protein